MENYNEGFVIDCDAKADWAIEKIKEAEAERDRLLKLVDEKRFALDQQENEIESRCKHDTSFLRSMLAQYFETVKAKETKTQKTYKLIAGSLVYKKPSVDYEKDENTLLQWLTDNGKEEFVQTVKKPKWGDFKKTIAVVDGNVIDATTGEVIECVKAIEKPGRFEVQ